MGNSNRGRRVLGAVIGAALFVSLSTVSAVAACKPSRVDIRTPGGVAHQFTSELADEPAEQSRGLMFRKELADTHGMLFVYTPPRRVAFWMRNTLIPLDMIYADRTGLVRKVHQNAVPLDETPIDGGPGISAVFEVRGGLTGELGIVPGSVLRHPFFGSGAAWPCE